MAEPSASQLVASESNLEPNSCLDDFVVVELSEITIQRLLRNPI